MFADEATLWRKENEMSDAAIEYYKWLEAQEWYDMFFEVMEEEIYG